MDQSGKRSEKNVKRVAIALIPGEGKTVLMGRRRDNGRLSTPGGHLEIGEDPHAGVVREVKEETGLTVTSAKLVHVGVTKFGTVIYTFLCQAVGSVNVSGDPDREFDNLSFINPLENKGDLHIPFEKSFPFQWLDRN